MNRHQPIKNINTLMTETTTELCWQAVDYDPFAGPSLRYAAPATEPQREIWTACQFSGAANRAYNESISLRLSGVLQQAVFERAWQSVMTRHEALRSAFSGDGEQQLFFDHLAVPLTITDLAQVDRQDDVVADLLKRDALFTFDLTNGPLVKASLLRLTDTTHQFVLTAHHLVCDGWSTGIILQDLSAFYSAYAQGLAPTLPPPDLFSHYALSQQRFSQSTDFQQVEQFWLTQFATLPPTLNLPVDAPYPTRRTYPSYRQDFRLDGALVQAIRQTSIALGCSLVTTLVAAMEVWLHRLTGQTDIVLGLPAAGQPATGYDRLVGHCVHLLPLRSAPQATVSFRQYLQQRKLELLDIFDNQQLTFGSLLKKLPISRQPGQIPLVPVVFNVDIGLAQDVAFAGLTCELTVNPRAFENFDLSLNISESGKSLQVEWSYNAQLFRASTIRTFQEQLVLVLQTLANTPDAAIGVLKSEKAAERTDGLLFDGSFVDLAERDNQPAYAPSRALSDYLSDTARRFPDKTALRFGAKTRSFSELNRQANQLARLLQAEGIRPGDRIGLALDRSIELIVSLIAVMKTGAAYVPTDPRHPDDRINYVLADANCKLLLTNTIHRGRFDTTRPQLLLETIWPKLGSFATNDLTTTVSGNGVIYVLYTSGTTGRPKGVLIRHQSVANVLFSVAQQPGLTAADKTITLATIAFDLATVEIYLPLLVGAELVLTDADTARNGESLAALLQAEQLTFMQATPATWRMLWETGWRGQKNLRIISCAEALSNDLATKLLNTCAELWNFYGPTETTIYATGKQIQTGDEQITIGPAIANTQIFIVGEDSKPTVEPGEIWIAGEGVSRGYLNQPDLTAEKFIDSPFANSLSATLYRTGDLGRFMPNGDVLYLGRIDQQIKIRGHRIEPAEIEYHLLRQPNIQDTVVIAREDQPGDQRLVAYVVLPTLTETKQDAQQQTQTWRQALRTVLPAYMVPTDFVTLPKLPVTPNGKIDRKALPAPTTTQPQSLSTRLSEPRTPYEQRLSTIWKSVFGLTALSIDDDFFDLGGHSMLAIQVMKQIEKQTNRRLPMSLLFEYPTVRELARMLDGNQAIDTHKSLVPIRPQGSLVPVYIIHGGGLNLLSFQGMVTHMNPEQPIYGLQARGLDGTEEPLDNMEAIAATYLAEVLEQNPTGPYALAGYSFGGYVAYEMARQLHAQGRTVKLLGMLDTNAQELVTAQSATAKLWQKVARQGPKLSWIANSFMHRPGPTLRYQAEFVVRTVQAVLQRVGLYQPPQALPEADHLTRLMDKHEIAYKNYVLRPYAGAIDLFRATDRLYFVDDFQYLGWKEYAAGGVRVYDVPGDHETLMLPPNDQLLAQALQRALDNR